MKRSLSSDRGRGGGFHKRRDDRPDMGAPAAGRGRGMVMPAWMTKDNGRPQDNRQQPGFQNRGGDRDNRDNRDRYTPHGGGPLRHDDKPRLNNERYGSREVVASRQSYPLGSRIGRFVVLHDSRHNREYYFNTKTKQVQWEKPPLPPPPPSHPPPAINGGEDWVEVWSQDEGRHYFWNERTDETKWDL